ncbi:hypothetical protein MUN89_04475 [Halobacillus salinarum]|uniref:RQC domain-containing protein n=1 Tax=Halobacillus salinarum TaxID=2932257 RepID=A0ABY4ENH3_9BACI|nr:RQC-minor-2 family DNA-binding protein [Halobacillus salinarum]UOQ45209.1 hypothetical protein MUN89_04475 [Halobacillus salinarum]
MGLPERITYQDERYPLIVLAPVGKKHKHIRSIGHKTERGLLSRLNDAIKEQVDSHSLDLSQLQRYLNIEGAILPVPFLKEETVYPHFLRPELFLWNELPQEQGLPLIADYLYEIDFTQLSSEKLEQHLSEVLEDYLFLADIGKHSKDYWLKKIAEAFHRHPIVRLAHKKREVIAAVETMNQSALLSLLKYPEDIAFWRNRVDTVMRPFRSLPKDWMAKGKSSCPHEKHLQFDASTRTICCFCESCDFCLFYRVDEDQVDFTESHDIEKAKKRLTAIERQFNDIASQNHRLLKQINQLKALKKQLTVARKKLDESLTVTRQIERYKKKNSVFADYPILQMYDQLSKTELPDRKGASLLVWLAGVELCDVNMIKKLPQWLQYVPENVYPLTSHILEELYHRLEEVRYGEEDIIITIKGRPLTYAYTQQILDLVHYYGSQYPAHTLVQMLAGKPTNKLRTLHLHETRWFGLLADWPEKYIQKLFNQLEKQGWLMKQQKGYSVSDFAEEVM